MAKHYGADSMMSTCAQSSLVRGHRSVAGLLLALALCLPLTASAGLDPRFGSGGKLFLDFPASAFTLDAFGNLYVAGATCGASCQLIIAKFDSTGAPVRSFGTNGTALISIGANSYASDIALDGSGNLYVSGVTEDAAHTLTSRAFAVVKLDSKGNLVTTFGDAGKQVVKYATDSVDEPPVGVVLTPAGSVYLSGTSIYGGTQFTVAKLDSSGNLSWLRAVRFGNNDQKRQDEGECDATPQVSEGLSGGNVGTAGSRYYPRMVAKPAPSSQRGEGSCRRRRADRAQPFGPPTREGCEPSLRRRSGEG